MTNIFGLHKQPYENPRYTVKLMLTCGGEETEKVPEKVGNEKKKQK